MDMVCEKRPDVDHDFTKDGLNISVKDGYITANGTTLGGDDGIAVAYGLALLDSTDIPHPPLEVLLTVDEEIGLLGAVGLDCSVLKSLDQLCRRSFRYQPYPCPARRRRRRKGTGQSLWTYGRTFRCRD